MQGALPYGLLSLVTGEHLPLLRYLVGMAGPAVHTLFCLALTLMMGVLTANRRTLLGASLGVLLVGYLLARLLGGFLGAFIMLTPWALDGTLLAAVLGQPLPVPVWLPIDLTAGFSYLQLHLCSPYGFVGSPYLQKPAE